MQAGGRLVTSDLAEDQEPGVPAYLRRLPEGVSYRNLDYWTRQGWLRPENGATPGSGRSREWPESELEIARRMARLTAAGITASVAAEFAREQWPFGDIAPGATLWMWEGPGP